MENGEGSFLLEDDTVPETREHFVTERSIELDNPYMYMEDNSRIVFEDDVVLIDEESGEEVHTFIPIGPTLKTLNMIAFQNTYRIGRFMYLESGNTAVNSGGVNTEYDREDEHRVVMEDGSGSILSEESVSEGLSIKQMSDMTGLLYVSEINKRQRKRTNIAFSSYVNSSNVSNSGL